MLTSQTNVNVHALAVARVRTPGAMMDHPRIEDHCRPSNRRDGDAQPGPSKAFVSVGPIFPSQKKKKTSIHTNYWVIENVSEHDQQ